MQEEIEVVGIRYKQNSKIYYFSPRNLDLVQGDEVLVDTANGVVYATVAMEKKAVKKTEIEEPLKNVIRKVTDKDRAQLEKNKKRAETSYAVVESKIKALGLPMNVTDIEYTFDESKVTIFYTSEDRVDFRELLKVLASALRTKIELRQISTREEVKMVGALGLCGRECCCTKFLNEPAHVVVKMAKIQNLSMSPTKTGGACGRMMCCLSYEEPTYKELLEKMPKVGSKVATPEGEGVVQYNNILKGIVTVKIYQNDDSYKLQEFTLQELGLEDKTKTEDGQCEVESKKNTQENTEVETNLLANEEMKEYNVHIETEETTNQDAEAMLNKAQNDKKQSQTEERKDKKNFNHSRGFKKKKFSHFKNNKQNNNQKKGDN